MTLILCSCCYTLKLDLNNGFCLANLHEFVDRDWTKAFSAGVESGHLQVVIWFCKNGMKCTWVAFRLAVKFNHLPMVKYLVRNGSLSDGPQPFELLWSKCFDDSHLPIAVFMFDTALEGMLSETRVKEAVQHAVDCLSVAPLEWLKKKEIYFDIALAHDHAVRSHGSNLDDAKVIHLLRWLEAQLQVQPSSRHWNAL